MSIPESVPSPDSSQEDAKSNDGASDSPANRGRATNSDAITDYFKSQSPTARLSRPGEQLPMPTLERYEEGILHLVQQCGADGGDEERITMASLDANSTPFALRKLAAGGFVAMRNKGSIVV
jgi:hypothetical protein